MHSVDEPTEASGSYAERDRKCWAWSIGLGLAFAVVAMIVSVEVFPAVSGHAQWALTGDTWMVTAAARHVWNGALGYVYEVNTAWYSLPLSAILLAPAVGLGDHLGLVDGSPAPLAHPTMWLLVEPYTLLFGILLLHATRRLAWDLGIRRRLWAVQLLAVVLVLVPAAEWGHFEDVVALACVLYAARRLLAGDAARSALWLAVAVASKQWAMLLIPFVVLAARPGHRLRTGLLAASLPGALALFVLGVDWRHASHALLFPTVVFGSNPGHAAFFAHWFGATTSRAGRALALMAAPLIAWRTRQWRTPATLLVAFAVVLLARVLLEPINYSYYWSPALLFVVLACGAAEGQLCWRDWVWPLTAMAWTLPSTLEHTWMGYFLPTVANETVWWVGQVALLSATAARVAVACGLTGRLTGNREAVAVCPIGSVGDSVKNVLQRPIANAMDSRAAAGDTSWTQ